MLVKGNRAMPMSHGESLIQNAVNFLQDPTVQSSPVSSRIIFLEKKGLSQAEIDQALDRAGLQRTSEGSFNVGNVQHIAGVKPEIPAKGPPKALTDLTVDGGFSWSKLTFYLAVVSGAAAAINVSSASSWIKVLFRRLRSYISILLYGQDTSLKPSPSISIDRLAEIRQEIAELKSTVQALADTVDTDVREEVQQVRDTVKFTYTRLEDEIEHLRHSIETRD